MQVEMDGFDLSEMLESSPEMNHCLSLTTSAEEEPCVMGCDRDQCGILDEGDGADEQREENTAMDVKMSDVRVLQVARVSSVTSENDHEMSDKQDPKATLCSSVGIGRQHIVLLDDEDDDDEDRVEGSVADSAYESKLEQQRRDSSNSAVCDPEKDPLSETRSADFMIKSENLRSEIEVENEEIKDEDGLEAEENDQKEKVAEKIDIGSGSKDIRDDDDFDDVTMASIGRSQSETDYIEEVKPGDLKTSSSPSNKISPTFLNLSPKLIVFVDLEADFYRKQIEENVCKGKKAIYKKYVCGHCTHCRELRCGSCFSCEQQIFGKSSEIWKLVKHRVLQTHSYDSCEIICESIQKCNAYKALIAPFLNRKYLEGFNSALRDNKITKVLPLCYPIPDSSPASSSVVVVLAIQHVMTALQEEQSVSKRQPKESVVSANILLTTRKSSAPDVCDKPKIYKKTWKKTAVAGSSDEDAYMLDDKDFDCDVANSNTEKTRWSERTKNKEVKRSANRPSGAAAATDSGSDVGAEVAEDDDSADDGKGDEGDDESVNGALEASMEDLQLMKETEIHEAIRMGHLKSKTRIRPDMFSETFRLKVGRFLSDGGNIKTLSTRLDLTPDTLRLWRRLHQSKSVQDKLKKQQERALQSRKRRTASKAKNEVMTSKVEDEDSSVKSISSEMMNHVMQLSREPPMTVIDHSYQKSKTAVSIAPAAISNQTKHFLHTITPSGFQISPTTNSKAVKSQVSPTKPILPNSALRGTVASKPLDIIYILDKGASDVSSEESDFDDELVPKPVLQNALPFLCNDCREIFRGPSQLQTHLYICPARIKKHQAPLKAGF